MKFLADMGISLKSVSFLNDSGHDAKHLHDQNLYRLSDADILVKAKKEGRILLTHDLDFGDLIAASGANLPSVIIFRLRNMQPKQVNSYLKNILK